MLGFGLGNHPTSIIPPCFVLQYIFNGDFVDRGDDGVEVMLVLLALKSTHPKYVHLNRGNHEDCLINDAYGFTEECMRKYDKHMLDLFVDMFTTLPLCTLIESTGLGQNGAIIVLHGGILMDPRQTLSDIDTINRRKIKTVHILDTVNTPEFLPF